MIAARARGCFAGLIAVALVAVSTAACRCPVPPGGPTSVGVTSSWTLAPGQLGYVDVDIPASTTQVNLNFTVDVTDASLHLRQIDPACTPAPGDTCQNISDSTVPPRPQGVTRFSNSSGLSLQNGRTRVVVENISSTIVNVTLNVVPLRAGCT